MTHAAWIYFFFFLSGLTALIYEVLWVRLVTLIFGNTVQATATVLGAFMTGLALGSFALGVWMDRKPRNGLRVYAGLEGGLALFALIFPWILQGLTPIYSWIYQTTEGGGALLVLARFCTTFFFLLLPTACMGGTLPALSKHVVSLDERVGYRVGALYALNTLGAVAGTLICGFWWIPALGTNGTNFAAVTLNLLIAAAAMGLAKSPPAVAPAPPPSEPDSAQGRRVCSPVLRRLVLVAYFAVGFAALALEVLWMRLLVQIFGSTIHAVSIMLAVFLLGISMGSEAMRRHVERIRNVMPLLGILLMVCGLVVVIMGVYAPWLSVLYLRVLAWLGLTWTSDVAARLAVSAALMGAPALLFGAAFPLVMRFEADVFTRLGQRVGTVYAANTLGAVLGSVAGGFLLLPWLGVQRSINVLGLFLSLAGLVVLAFGEAWQMRRRAQWALGLIVPAAFLAGGMPKWDPRLLSAGVYMRPKFFIADSRKVQLEKGYQRAKVFYFREGKTATVAVVQEGHILSLRLDGKIMMTNNPTDRRLGLLLGHLPMLLHPNPKDTFNIGLGAAFTVAALAAHDAERIEVAEVEPAVVEAAGEFRGIHRDVLTDPRLRLIFNDGRNHLLLTDKRYDVITSDPIDPIVTGAASLFTREHFLLARQRLKQNGIMCQWVPLYEMEPVHYQSILKTFFSVFPHVTVWYTGHDTLLIGSEQPLTVDFEKIARRMQKPEVGADLRAVGVEDAHQLLGSFIFEIGPGHPFEANVPLNSDRRPFIEFATPKSRWKSTRETNTQYLLEHKQALPRFAVFPDEETRLRTLAASRAQADTMRKEISPPRSDPRPQTP